MTALSLCPLSLLHFSHNGCRFASSKKLSWQIGHGIIWSTQVAGVIRPCRWHSAHRGWAALYALDSLVHRDVWYGSADRSLT